MVSRNMRHIHFRDASFVGTKIMFSAVEVNGLFVKEKGSNTADFVSSFPGVSPEKNNLHAQIIEYDGKLFFIPLWGTGISIYDKNTRKMETIACDIAPNIQIAKGYLIGQNIALIPLDSDTPFMLFHIHDNTYERLSYLKDFLESSLTQKRIWFDIFSTVMNRDVLYLVMPDTNILIICDIVNRLVSFKRAGTDFHFDSITIFNGKIYILTKEGKALIEYDEKNDTWRLIRNDIKQLTECTEKIIVSSPQNMYLISTTFIGKWNIEKEKFEIIKVFPNEFDRKETPYRFFAGVRIEEDDLWVFSASGKGVLRINDENVEIYETLMNEDTRKKDEVYCTERLNCELKSKGYVTEENVGDKSLESFIKLISGAKFI